MIFFLKKDPNLKKKYFCFGWGGERWLWKGARVSEFILLRIQNENKTNGRSIWGDKGGGGGDGVSECFYYESVF